MVTTITALRFSFTKTNKALIYNNIEALLFVATET
jgi:hypothetical protein